MSGPVNIFIYCTFRIVPRNFHQFIIVMTYSEGHKTYAPIFFILLQSRKQTTYYHAFQQVICASDWTIKAKTITADFEQALLKAISYQFPKGPFVGCNFIGSRHFAENYLIYIYQQP